MSLKKLVGKTVYLKPTGNNARRWDGQPVIAVIKKVARVNIEIEIITEGGCYPRNYRYSGNNLHCGSNSGYVVFEDEASFNEDKELIELSNKVNAKLRFASDFAKLGLERLRELAGWVE